jgi:predicted ATP-grasp superfamily ATP-dependent carboligase
VYPETITDAIRTLDSLLLPCVAKSIDPRRRDGAFKCIVRTESDLLAALRAVDISNLMLQEYIPGDDTAIWIFNGCFDETSRCLAGFTGRKLRQWPPHRGVTSLGICEGNAVVEELTQRLAVASGYSGPIDVGYRYDARDREYKLLDFNPRIGGTFRLFVGEEGLDVIRAHYLHLTGQPVPASVPRSGRKWLREEDLVGGWRYLRDGKLTLAGWVRSLRGVEETAWYAGDDPVPALLRPVQALCAGATTPVRRRRGS